MRKISFVIPCYNSEKTIMNVINEIKQTVGKRENDTYEIILVNDFSRDNVWSVIQKACEEDENIKGICLSKNFGQHSALMAGYRETEGDIVVSLDDDGQTPADEVYALIDKLDCGCDVVYASYSEKKHSTARNMGTKLNNFMCEKLLGKPKGLMITSFFVAKKYVIDEMIKYKNSFTYIPGLVLRTTESIDSMLVNHRERKVGSSGYSFLKLLALWMNGFTAFSVVPLRISTIIGMCSAGAGFIYLIYVIVNKFVNPSVPVGWSSTTAVLLLLGGMILFVLGMMGEYLGRVYISLNNAPQYVIAERTGGKEKKEGK